MKPRGATRSLVERYALRSEAAVRLELLVELLATDAAPSAVRDTAEIVDVHLADSLVALELSEVREARLIADLGAGAGVPGLVLAVALPGARVVLVESVGRKCAFLREAVVRLELGNVEVACVRAEAWGEGLGRCDVVCARALAALPVLCEYAAPLLREGGVLVAWKGRVEPEEARDGEAAAERLGLAVQEVRAVTPYPGSRHRTMHVLRKVAATPAGFPRRPGVAAKRPLRAG